MSRKYISYENARRYIYDKDLYLNNYVDMMFNRTQKMFKWENLPTTIPQEILEKMLQKNGNVFFTKLNNDYYVFNGGLGGEPNIYYEPTIYTVANPTIKESKNYKIDIDGILIKNDMSMLGLLPIFYKSAVLNCDCEISLNMLSVLLRTNYLISASDDKTKNSAEVFLNKIKNGDFSVIANSQFFDGVKLQSLGNESQIINQFIQLSQYIKASALNEIGINANFNMKKERLITSEVQINESALLPLVENMLECRKNACVKINEMYGLNIDVELNCVWREQVETHEQNIIEQNNEIVENTDVENTDVENGDVENENV